METKLTTTHQEEKKLRVTTKLTRKGSLVRFVKNTWKEIRMYLRNSWRNLRIDYGAKPFICIKLISGNTKFFEKQNAIAKEIAKSISEKIKWEVRINTNMKENMLSDMLEDECPSLVVIFTAAESTPTPLCQEIAEANATDIPTMIIRESNGPKDLALQEAVSENPILSYKVVDFQDISASSQVFSLIMKNVEKYYYVHKRSA